ncbi:MAG: right-handed parallel beta-helix repeat-containing protein [Chitinophagaceae bacterium]|nr:right-handed parallel beta-helix repeat-containing protein [Chitinophagaceae bacterium]
MRNKTVILFFIGLLTFQSSVTAQSLQLKKGVRLQQSGSVKSKTYQLPTASLEAPVIVVAGDNITIDFKNALLQGDAPQQLPDSYEGLGILIENSNNVTIRNLRVRGYKVGLMARNVRNLRLENCDFSYNYRQRLNSTILKEDEVDWMSYHHNEKDEWLRYGAGIYFRDCDSAKVLNCKVTGGQNALMMTACNGSEILNNDFSFNSGIGIGLYRSSNNLIAHNKTNFNVRGYSHGIYHRGQDSAGFLVYEQSNNNTFYKNSATHSGDGFFLWAGQSTMDNGQGGCNDNLIVGNDFSYAPTNGIEVTFSRNIISRNRLFDCDHGIWGGYSFETRIADNQFRNNRIAIAIEHGQSNIIDFNIFHRDKEAIRLWARATQPDDWGGM